MGKMSEKVEKILQQYNIPQEKYQEIGKELANRYTKLNEITQSFSSTLSQRTEINEEGLNVLSNAISKISKIIDIISKFYLTSKEITILNKSLENYTNNWLGSISSFLSSFEKNRMVPAENLALLKLAGIDSSFCDFPSGLASSLDSINHNSASFLVTNLDYFFELNTKCFFFKSEKSHLNGEEINDISYSYSCFPETEKGLIEKYINLVKEDPYNTFNCPEANKLKAIILNNFYATSINDNIIIFYRSVCNNENSLFDEQRMRNSSSWGYPKRGRFNLPEENNLYLCSTLEGSKEEILKHNAINSIIKIQAARFTKRPNEKPKIINLSRFNSFFVKKILSENVKLQPEKYIIPSFFAWVLKSNKISDGIEYKVRKNDNYTSFVFWKTNWFSYKNLGFI